MKTSCTYLFVIVISFFTISAYAQNTVWAFGFDGGLSTRNLTDGAGVGDVTTGNHLVFGPEAAVFAEFKYSPVISFQPMIEYSAQGSKDGGFTTGVNTQSTYSNPNFLNNRANLNYLLIPLMAKFGWTVDDRNTVRFYLAAGPFAGFLLSANQTVYDDIPNSGNNQDVKGQLNTFNAGVEGKLGITFIAGRGNFFLEGGGNYGFLKTQKANVNSGSNTGSGIFDIGYSYWIGVDPRRTNNSIRL